MVFKSIAAALFLCNLITSVVGIYYPVEYLANHCNENEPKVIKLRSGHEAVVVIKGSEGIVRSLKGLNCSLKVVPPENHHLALRVKRLFVDATVAGFEVKFGNETKISGGYFPEDSSIITEYLADTEVLISLRGKHLPDEGCLELEFVFTSFIPIPKDGDCPPLFYFDCGNGRCIREMFRCDDHNNCGNDFEEKHCRELSFASLLLINMFILTCLVGMVYKSYKTLISRGVQPNAVDSVFSIEKLREVPCSMAEEEQLIPEKWRYQIKGGHTSKGYHNFTFS